MTASPFCKDGTITEKPKLETVTIPEELAGELRRQAEQRQTTMEELVREALGWYLRIDAELWDELSAWQEVRDEALQLVEGDAT